MRRRSMLAAGLIAACIGAAPTARAQHRPPPVIIVPGGPQPIQPYAQTLYCYSDVRLFHTLRDGHFPYCRENLRYRPGALECFQLIDQICSVLVPGSLQPVETRGSLDRVVIPCPDGPEPPVCRRLDIR